MVSWHKKSREWLLHSLLFLMDQSRFVNLKKDLFGEQGVLCDSVSALDF
ncbi:hypothetical protein [Chengkuizengella sediminis]|nr:hypothetical protein [Chengkuizengella sediminis]NDI35174.1 hypothetical protein [Chengkuizengella sediminis]